MSVQEQIKILCVKKNISVSELARLTGSSPQAFIQKMKRNRFNVDDLKMIAEKVNCKFETSFILENNEKIIY